MIYINKKLVSLIISVFFLATTSTIYAENVSVFVNKIPINTEAFTMNDLTYIPLRAVSEALGAKVSWDDASQSAYIDFNEDAYVSNLIQSSSESVVAIVGNFKGKEITAHGTGVVIKSGGVILTNAHVVSDIENITAVFSNGESHAAQVQYIDTVSDLAVIKVGKLGLKPLSFADPGNLVAGNSVIAIGTPLSLNMRNTATKGIISGVDVALSDSFYPLIQTDAAINAGNSGGPLINMKGQLIGINSSKYAGVGIEGMAFSIPIETINYVLNQFETNGRVIRPSIGVTFEQSWEARIGLPTQKGITVKSSSIESLKVGDIINYVNGVEVHSILDYNKVIRDTYISGDIEFMLTSGSEEKTVTVTPELK